MNGRRSRWRALLLAALVTVIAPTWARAAESLRLAPDLSFTDDSSSRFPIEGDRLGDAELVKGRAALVFFGAAHCWNTNREAERVIALYPKFRDRVRFIIVDVGHPSHDQRPLMKAHYHGYIPTLAILAGDGTVIYERSGETARERGDSRALAALLEKATGS